MNTPIKHSASRLRLATLSSFSPHKLGSGEDAYVSFAKAATERGHSWTLFCHEPIHPTVQKEFYRTGANIQSLTELERRPLQALNLFRHSFDVVELNLIAPRSPIALAAYAAWPCSVIFIDRVSGPPEGEDTRANWASRALDRITMLRVNRFAGVSEYVRARGEKRFGLPLNKTRVLYNGVDTTRFHSPVRPPQNRNEIKILCVGYLIPEKGMDVLLKAIADVTSERWSLTIIGEGPEGPSLYELANNLGIQRRVEFLGLRDDVDRLLREADIFAHPAVWEEAFGHTVVEGMASGCCVLASKVGGIPELMVDQQEGLLIEPGDVASWTDALSRCCQDAGLRLHLGTAARARVLRDFPIERRMNEELALFEDVAR